MLSQSNEFIRFAVDSGLVAVDIDLGIVLRNGKPLYVHPDRNGYGRVKLVDPRDGKQKKVYAHRIIAYAIHGDIVFTVKVVVDHDNENRINNRGYNLKLLSGGQNTAKWHGSMKDWYRVVVNDSIIATCKNREDAEIIASQRAGEIVAFVKSKKKG